MGYRSDVVYAFYVQDRENYPMLKLWFDENYPHKEAKEEWGATVETTTDAVVITYDAAKWDDSYTHMREVAAAVDNFDVAFRTDDAEECIAHWECARIGEEPEDAQRDGSPYNEYRLSIRREICFD